MYRLGLEGSEESVETSADCRVMNSVREIGGMEEQCGSRASGEWVGFWAKGDGRLKGSNGEVG